MKIPKMFELPPPRIFTNWLSGLEYDWFPFGFRPIFRGENAVSFREKKSNLLPYALVKLNHLL